MPQIIKFDDMWPISQTVGSNGPKFAQTWVGETRARSSIKPHASPAHNRHYVRSGPVGVVAHKCCEFRWSLQRFGEFV